MWSVMWRPRVMNVVSAVSVATFGAMCRHERVQVKIGGLRRTSGAMELRAHAMRPQHSMTANVETKILPNAQLAQLPGRVCSAMPDADRNHHTTNTLVACTVSASMSEGPAAPEVPALADDADDADKAGAKRERIGRSSTAR